mmetsp:Transcript_50128/g.44942  ORF Transcript_50128/g.44942 Transcript_50128/m.44942 type:complete len:719 (+) Transcript_50128:71-2227(+)
MFIQLIIFAFAFILSQAIEFAEPDIVTLEHGKTYYLRAEYCEISNTEFRMSGRCWSLKGPGENAEYSVASSPGPTLKMIAGTTFSIVLQNNFVNSVQSEEDCHNSYCEMDKLNLHTHGLHISSSQDDVLVDLKPRISSSDVPNEYTYTYTIPEDHYPGVHWYHPHNHGAVSHQIHFGLFGAIITEYPESAKYEAAGCSELYTDGDSAYQTNILVFSSVYAVNTALCTCEQGILDVSTLEGSSNAAREGAAAYGRCAEHGKNCFHQYSACYEYCAFEGSRDDSDLDYDVEITSDSDIDTDGIDQFGLVNGIYNPTITITQSKYRRLQFVNTMHQYYIHYKFPTECTILLLGYDGIFFDYYRNLNDFSNELLLSSGSRADLLIKCDAIDTYEVVTISLDGQSANEESDFDTLERFGSDQDDIDDPKKLFTISVVSDNQGDSISDPPTAIPERPNYLKDLQNIEDTEIDSNCACNQYSGDGSDLCYIHYSSKDLMAVNNEEFSDKDRYLTYMIQDRVYEFNLKTDRHVHHQHVYPFQVMENIGTGGFIAQAGDFFDTMGAESERLVRTHTADFSGYMMLHCHILPHEDEGMMALMYVLSESEAAGTDTPSPSSSPTEDCLADLIERQAYSGSSAPSPTVNSGKPSKTKGGSSLFVDFQFNDLNLKQHNGIWIFSIITMFMLLTLCNTCMICQARRRGSKIMGNRMYGVVDEKDIDYIDEDI